jgi:hypothetical protein
MNVSFMHYGDENMASYRYRCRIPAQQIGASINNADADILVFSKPTAQDVRLVGNKVTVVDYCDPHFDRPEYLAFARFADVVTCPTEEMAKIIHFQTGRHATVIPDPYEYFERIPHCFEDDLLWFGHSSNAESLMKYRDLPKLRVVSNFKGATQWSKKTMLLCFDYADIVIMPATAEYKSPNRTVEAIRQGCFVVAEPHPAIMDIPGIWIGDIREGIEWAKHNKQEANERITKSQEYVRKIYSPEHVGNAWKTLLTGLTSTLDAVESVGMAS